MLDRSVDISQPLDDLNDNEKLKASSNYLRGTISKGLSEAITGSMSHDDTLLMKFHGIYQQDNRDVRAQRRQRQLEPIYQFMVRMRIPGGNLSADQWIGIDNLSQRYAERGVRITTRGTVQLHGVRKWDLRALMQGIRDLGLDTIAACGDDSRGVVSGSNPYLSEVHQQVSNIAQATSDYIIPKTEGYGEIWYENQAKTSLAEQEPVYGKLYLPRKFKVGFAIPPVNDIDVYGQDLGLIAVVKDNTLLGFNVCIGGGMGQLDTRDDSYPRLAEQLGFIEANEAPQFSETVMAIQRDFGDRKDRHRARFKYTLDRLGNAWFLNELETRRGKPLAKAQQIKFDQNGDRLGWQQGDNGLFHATLYIESGRIEGPVRDQLAGFMQQYAGRVRLTTNQNFQLTDIEAEQIPQIETRLDDLSLAWRLNPSHQAAHTVTCVALPTCGLAMAEAERYAPRLIHIFEQMKARYDLDSIPITLRLTGCPNGCARPYLAEVALTGRAPGLYNLYLGGSFHGDRLNTLHTANVDEEAFINIVSPLLERFSLERNNDEYFGDFLVRKQLLETPAQPLYLN